MQCSYFWWQYRLRRSNSAMVGSVQWPIIGLWALKMQGVEWSKIVKNQIQKTETKRHRSLVKSLAARRKTRRRQRVKESLSFPQKQWRLRLESRRAASLQLWQTAVEWSLPGWEDISTVHLFTHTQKRTRANRTHVRTHVWAYNPSNSYSPARPSITHCMLGCTIIITLKWFHDVLTKQNRTPCEWTYKCLHRTRCCWSAARSCGARERWIQPRVCSETSRRDGWSR